MCHKNVPYTDSLMVNETHRTQAKQPEFSKNISVNTIIAYKSKKPADSAMPKHCFNYQYEFNKVTGKLIYTCSKGKFMNCAGEAETIAAFKTGDKNLLNDLTATFVTQITRYIYDQILFNASDPSATGKFTQNCLYLLLYSSVWRNFESVHIIFSSKYGFRR